MLRIQEGASAPQERAPPPWMMESAPHGHGGAVVIAVAVFAALGGRALRLVLLPAAGVAAATATAGVRQVTALPGDRR